MPEEGRGLLTPALSSWPYVFGGTCYFRSVTLVFGCLAAAALPM